MKRFCRGYVIEVIRKRIDAAERHYGFHRRTGWAQVEGKSTETVVAYGAYEELYQLLMEFL